MAIVKVSKSDWTLLLKFSSSRIKTSTRGNNKKGLKRFNRRKNKGTKKIFKINECVFSKELISLIAM